MRRTRGDQRLLATPDRHQQHVGALGRGLPRGFGKPGVYGEPDKASSPGVDSARAAKPDQPLLVGGMSSCAVAGAPKTRMKSRKTGTRPAHLNRIMGKDDRQDNNPAGRVQWPRYAEGN
jgi:hypothetical protein